MACCKNQSAPWGDILMYENPTDELYFGEVYRTILQEAWLPEGAEDWQRTGKSRRGRRPTQQGLYPHSPTPEQAIIRQCFSKCAAAWNALPWDNPDDPTCDGRWGKEYWKKEKDDRGVPCSYYDLFMRYCLRHCIDTSCIMPSAYTLDCGPDLTGVVCKGEYHIPFSEPCGPISKVSGDGTFSPPDLWTAPGCGEEGQLVFKDQNGAQGCVNFTFDPSYYCNGLIWPDTNPAQIARGTQETIYVEGGTGPYHWEVSGTDFSLASADTDGPTNTLIAGPNACGTAAVHVTDFCDYEVDGHVPSDFGQWIHKGDYCGLPGSTTWYDLTGNGALYFHFELISGYQKQYQKTAASFGDYGPGGNCDQVPQICADWNEGMCGGGFENCIDGDFAAFYPYVCDPVDGYYRCFCVKELKYYEWEC